MAVRANNKQFKNKTMKKTIWKFPLVIKDAQIIEMPKKAEFLTVQMQNGIACLWAMVDPSEEKERRLIEIIGTGNPVEMGIERKYIATFQLYEGQLVFHVFERW